MLKVVNDFIKKVFGKDEFVLLIKSVMVQNINKKIKDNQRRSLPQEIIISDRNISQTKNNVNYESNDTLQIVDSIAHYYQKVQNINFVLTNKTKFISPSFGVKFMNTLQVSSYYQIMDENIKCVK